MKRLCTVVRSLLLVACLQLLFLARSAIASVEWLTDFPQVVISQGFAQTTFSVNVPPTASLISSTSANGNGADQNYKILADQLGQASFLLVNAADAADTIALTVTYQDGSSQVLVEGVNSSSNFAGQNTGSNPQVTLNFNLGGCFWGTCAWGKTYFALIDFCAFSSALSCGASSGANVQFDHSSMAIVFRGLFAGGGHVIVSGLDDLPMSDQGSEWAGSDDFCAGVIGATNLRIRAVSQTGSGVFQMQGPAPADLLNYQLNINGTAMTESTFQSFVGQSFSDCVNNVNGFTIDATATNTDVGNANPGNYSDVITLTVEPI